MRRLGWGLRILFNLFRLPVFWILTCGKIRFSLTSIISPLATLSIFDKGKISLGKKIGIEAGTTLQATIGEIIIGDGVYINKNCNIISRKSIILGDRVTIGPNVSIYDHDHNFRNEVESSFKTSSINIGKNVWIGANSIILKGVTIGNNCVVGAGTIVTKNIPPDTIVTCKIDLILKEITFSGA